MLSLGATTRTTALIAALLFSPAARAAPRTPPAARAAPRTPPAAPRQASLVPGEMIRYRLQYRSGIDAHSTSPIYTPESAHHMDVSLSADLRLDVLSVKTNAKLGRRTRLRVTYETSDASVHSDAYDPGAKALAKQYRNLKGRSFTFTIDASGRVRDVTGLARLEPDERARNEIRGWLRTLTLPLNLWQPGMKPGKKWTSVVPLADSPLAGLAWRTESVYRGDEPCPPAPGAPAAIARETCAVIDAQMETIRRKTHGGPTPLAYRRQGLRTSGRWQEHGASRSYVSLATGLVTSSTATESSDMDLTITAQLSGSKLHYAGKIESSSQLTLIAFHRPPQSRIRTPRH